jgi:putative transposase
MDDAETDVLAFMSFPPAHRTKLHSTNPIEPVNGEIKRRTEVVGIFPNEAAIRRLVGAILLEPHDEWAFQRSRYRTLEIIGPLNDDPIVGLPAVAPCNPAQTGERDDRIAQATPRAGTRSP